MVDSGIEPGRASVIVAGVIVLREVLTAYGLSEIEVSERDVLHGAAFAAAELPGARGGRRASRRLYLLLTSRPDEARHRRRAETGEDRLTLGESGLTARAGAESEQRVRP